MRLDTSKYWETEVPEKLCTDRNVFRFYPQAQQLGIHKSDWLNIGTGETRPGKGVHINLRELRNRPEVLRRLVEILQNIGDAGE